MAQEPTDEFGDWSPEEFRRSGRAAVDWVADYFARIPELPVVPSVAPGDVAALLPDSPPEEGEPFENLLRDLDKVVVPGLTHWNHPGFLAYFGVTASGPGILGELVASAFNTNGMLWKTSPATTEVELRMMSWLLQMFHLPRSWFGLIVDTASVSTFLALAAAREAVADFDLHEEGLGAPGAPRLRVYASEQAHSSVDKAVMALGLGRKGIRHIATDTEFRMQPAELEAAIEEDRRNGWHPMAVVGSVGTTSTTSVDPIPELVRVCSRHGLWLHVDAAYAGSAALLPEKRAYFAGCEDADSYVFNPHKWLFVPIDLSVLYTKHPDVLRRAFQLVPDYLRSDDDGTNLMDYGIQLGRRFRAIKLWWVIRTFGVSGISQRIREHCRLAEEFRNWAQGHPDFEVVAPLTFSTVCLRGVWNQSPEASSAWDEELARRVTAEGRAFVATTKLRGRTAIRVAVGNIQTDSIRMSEVRSAFERIRTEIAAEIAEGTDPTEGASGK